MRSQRPHKDDESEKWPYPIWHLAALRTARENGIVTVGFTGTKGKTIGEFCDHLFVSPSDDTPVVQQIHLTAAHGICDEIEQAMMRGAAGR
jgi:D-sedoheptulose 7-phosphate isomerase